MAGRRKWLVGVLLWRLFRWRVGSRGWKPVGVASSDQGWAFESARKLAQA